MLYEGPLSQLDSPCCFIIKAQLAAGNSHIFGIFTPKLGRKMIPVWNHQLLSIFTTFGEMIQFDSYFSNGLFETTNQTNSVSPSHEDPFPALSAAEVVVKGVQAVRVGWVKGSWKEGKVCRCLGYMSGMKFTIYPVISGDYFINHDIKILFLNNHFVCFENFGMDVFKVIFYGLGSHGIHHQNNHLVREKIFGTFSKQIQVDYPALMGTSVCPFPFVDGLFSGNFC